MIKAKTPAEETSLQVLMEQEDSMQEWVGDKAKKEELQGKSLTFQQCFLEASLGGEETCTLPRHPHWTASYSLCWWIRFTDLCRHGVFGGKSHPKPRQSLIRNQDTGKRWRLSPSFPFADPAGGAMSLLAHPVPVWAGEMSCCADKYEQRSNGVMLFHGPRSPRADP